MDTQYETKQCQSCLQEKTINNFGKNQNRFRSSCKECENDRDRANRDIKCKRCNQTMSSRNFPKFGRICFKCNELSAEFECKCCNIIKPLKNFYVRKSNKWRSPVCYACTTKKKQSKEGYYLKTREKNRIARENFPEKIMFSAIKCKAKREKIPFNLELSDIIIPKFCPILGIMLHRNLSYPNDHSPSLDKIIPTLGYIKGNIRVISMRANRLKSDGTLDEFMAIIKYITENAPK